MKTSTNFSPEVRERTVRMVREHQDEHESQWAAMGAIAAKIGCTAETLRRWVRQAEQDNGERAGVTSAERERIKALERGKPVKTTVSNPAAACPQDRVNRPFTAVRPNALWVSDFTDVSTAQGFVYVAFIIDGFARYIVG